MERERPFEVGDAVFVDAGGWGGPEHWRRSTVTRKLKASVKVSGALYTLNGYAKGRYARGCIRHVTPESEAQVRDAVAVLEARLALDRIPNRRHVTIENAAAVSRACAALVAILTPDEAEGQP